MYSEQDVYREFQRLFRLIFKSHPLYTTYHKLAELAYGERTLNSITIFC